MIKFNYTFESKLIYIVIILKLQYFDVCIDHDSCYFKNNGINYCQTIKQVLICVSIILFDALATEQNMPLR